MCVRINNISLSLLTLFTCACTIASAQTGFCPTNLDFENGDFTNWACRTGYVSDPGGANTITWTGTAQVNGRHDIISSATAGVDPYGGFSEVCPNGSGFSVKLGNNQTDSEAEGLSYTYSIPSTLTVFSILFNYAVVLQNPSHTVERQPRFRARIIDLTTNSPLPCVTFDFSASSSLPGFMPSPGNPGVLYKSWTPVSINLSSYIGKTIMIEFITSDCTQGGHFGYAYVDINSACNGAIGGTTICMGDTSITLNAPFGFQSYAWYLDNTFTQLLSATQSLTLSPTPTVGSIFPVIVRPYPGFGCADTLYANITISAKPVSNAGPDTTICKYQQVQIGGPAVPGLSYSWVPALQVNNATTSSPFVWNNASVQTEFVVKATDLLNGCFSYDTTIVSTQQVNTGITQNGRTEYCAGDTSKAVLSVSNISTNIQWYDANGQITGAIQPSYSPTMSGNYWASVTQSGCTDSTSIHPIDITIHQRPQALFSPLTDTGCVVTNLFNFTNTSSVPGGAAMSFLWKFSDGNFQYSNNATKTFSGLGIYNIELVASTAFGCKDSVTGVAKVFANGVPDFSWDSVCVDRPVLFNNLSAKNNWPEATYYWEFNNNGTGSFLEDPLPVTYTNVGLFNVKLTMTIKGCENDPKSIIKSIVVNKPVNGIRYRDITVPLGVTWPVYARDTVGKTYSWTPQVSLNTYTQQNPVFNSINDVTYIIDITDSHTCVTTDTLTMMVLKKPGFYMPTAFTPNGDGLNDVAIPYLVGMKSLKTFSIYNRSGAMIFHTNTYGKGWDGLHEGRPQPAGVYIWLLEFVTNDDKKIIEKGTITVIR